MPDEIPASATKTALVYGKQNCPHCNLAKMLLTKNNYTIDYISLDDDEARKEFYEKVTKDIGGPVMSVPQIWLNDKYIGGYSNLVEYIKQENAVKFDEEF